MKVNLLLTRLPRLADPTVTPEQAFGGTFHVNETWSQLHEAHQEASAGRIPRLPPCEIYCHSLTDPSILGESLRARGAHTLTLFGLQLPHQLVGGRPRDRIRRELVDAVLRSLDSVLAEPIRDVVMSDSGGAACIEGHTTADLEAELELTGGNIFHGPLAWPFLDDHAERATAAQRWGVATRHPRILLCGSAAVRGGGVSGIGGHNAAMAVLEN